MSEESNSSVARRAETPTDTDAELRDAVERLQAAIGHDHDTLERLRAGLADLALAVARAKAQPIEPEAAAPGKLDLAALLNEFEARVAGLIALLDVPTPDQGEPSEVPTVSHVMFGHSEEPGGIAADAPTVSALGAMVEKLAASMFPAPQQAETATGQAIPPSAEAEPPRPAVLPDLDLMSNLARMEAIPHLPVELGTAVIFDKPAEREPAAPEPIAEPQDAPAPEAIAPPITEAAALPEPEPVAEPTDLDPAGILDQPPPSVPLETEADNDPAGILQPPAPAPEAEAEADSDPAGFLLEPLPDATAPAAAPTQSQLKIPHDPLAPLKALSDVEKIALFS